MTVSPASIWAGQKPYLELLWEIEGNSVVLVSRLEVCSWLHKGDHRRSHANLSIVHIVSRNVSEQSLRVQQHPHITCTFVQIASHIILDAKAPGPYRESFGNGCLKVGALDCCAHELGCN